MEWEVYGQANPSTGKTSWYLPSGKYYYMESRAKGLRQRRRRYLILINLGWWGRGRTGEVGMVTGEEGELVNHNSQILKFSNSQMRSN